MDRGKELPVIIYSVSSDTRNAVLGNRFVGRNRSVSLRFYTQDYNDICAVVDAVRARYDGFFGPINITGAGIAHAEVTNVVESFDSSDDLTYMAAFTIEFITRD